MRCSLLAIVIPFMFVSLGCEKKETPPPTPEEMVQIKAKLVAADAYDGTADNVVVRCAVCMFGMDGTTDHTIEAHDHSLRFCKAGCKKKFGKDVNKSILAMEVPQ